MKRHNKWLTPEEGLSNSEFTDTIKMLTNTAPVRAIAGRSRDGTGCRRCSSNETQNFVLESLPHVLGSCQFGQLARINRHNQIRSLIANEFKKKGFETYEEVSGLEVGGSTRRIDVIAINREGKKGIIVDPTVRFEIGLSQPAEVNDEKRGIYVPTVPFYKDKYKLEEIEVIGLLIGARGTITSLFHDFCKRFDFDENFMKMVAQSTLRGSINVLRHHLYN